MSGVSNVKINDFLFEQFISEAEIKSTIEVLAVQINKDYAELNPVFIIVLSGAFIFAADLLREIEVSSDITVVKIKSYAGFESTGNVEIILPPDLELANRHLVIVEDIVDSARTLYHFTKYLQNLNPLSIETVCLLSKPKAHLFELSLKYIGREVENDFVIGYGLDYNGRGRNLKHIYRKLDLE